MARKHIHPTTEQAERLYWERRHEWEITIAARDSNWSDMADAGDLVRDARETWAKALARAYASERRERVSLATARGWVEDFIEHIETGRLSPKKAVS